MDEDVARLLEFLERLDRLITFIFGRLNEVTPSYLHESLGNMHEPYRGHLGVLRSAVAGAANNDSDMAYLTNHGLTGAELTAKLAGFNNAFGNFEITKDSEDDGLPWLRFAKNALKWAGIVLGSLGGLCPAAGALNEIRQVIEKAIEDAESPNREPDMRLFKHPHVPRLRELLERAEPEEEPGLLES